MNSRDKELWDDGKARRSRAGSLQPRSGKRFSSNRRAAHAPEAVVKVVDWAKSPASVRRMLEYVGRTTGIDENEHSIEELHDELSDKLENGEFKSEQEERAAAFALEICTVKEEYLKSCREIDKQHQEALRQNAHEKGRVDSHDIHQRFQKKHADNFDYHQAHIWNMGEAHGIAVAVTTRTANAFNDYERIRHDIENRFLTLLEKQHGKVSEIPEDKHTVIEGKRQANEEKFTAEIYDTVAGLGVDSPSIRSRKDAKKRQRHPKAIKGIEMSLEDDLGAVHKGSVEVQKLHDEWAKDFGRKRTGKRAPRHAVHLVLSAKSELNTANLEKVKAAARNTAQKHFGSKGYEFALGVHQDGSYPHAHLIVKSKNRETGKKLDIRKNDIPQLRKTFAKELSSRGLQHVATRRSERRRSQNKSRPSNWAVKEEQDIIRSTQALIKNLRKEQRAFNRKMARKDPKFDALQFREAQRKSLETQKDKIKKDKMFSKAERLKIFNELRSCRRDILKSYNPEREAKASVRYHVHSVQKWDKAYSKLEKELVANKRPPKELAEKKQKIEKEWGKIEYKNRRCLKQIKAMDKDLSAEERKLFFRNTRSAIFTVSKARGMGLGKER